MSSWATMGTFSSARKQITSSTSFRFERNLRMLTSFRSTRTSLFDPSNPWVLFRTSLFCGSGKARPLKGNLELCRQQRNATAASHVKGTNRATIESEESCRFNPHLIWNLFDWERAKGLFARHFSICSVVTFDFFAINKRLLSTLVQQSYLHLRNKRHQFRGTFLDQKHHSLVALIIVDWVNRTGMGSISSFIIP